ncbi:MAG: type II toxin-antitoxin system VapC family toxin [Myxococcaceae bacterium]
MILLDTNALLFLLHRHPRARRLERYKEKLAVSPFSVLELAFLAEVGRARMKVRDPVQAVSEDGRWTYDSAPLDAVVAAAMSLNWTHDPFDRLICGHALSRQWRLATADTLILEKLPPSATLEL